MKISDKDRQRRVDRAQMRVLFNCPFFAPAIAKLPIEFDPSVKTACTDGRNIKWNPDWFDSLADAVLPTVLCHEAWHCMYGHLWRAPQGVDWGLWNEATDHAVNNGLKEFSAIVMKGNLADPFPFPEPADAYLADPAFAGMAEERIYRLLSARKPPGGEDGPSGGGPGKGGKGKGKGPGQPGQPGNQPGQGQGQHSMPSFGDIVQPQGAQADPTEQKKLASEWDQTLSQCAAIAKGRGNLPAGVARYVEELHNPEVPWYELVRQWLVEKACDDWNWHKPNPYFDESGFILPSLDNERMGQIVFGKDTSGSIDQAELARFVCEQQNCLDDMRPEVLVDICCDSVIHRVKEYRVGDTIDRDAPGGGGTSFVPIFDYVGNMDKPPKCVVILTDMDGRFPKSDPGYPVLWVNYGERDAKAPFGDVVYVKGK